MKHEIASEAFRNQVRGVLPRAEDSHCRDNEDLVIELRGIAESAAQQVPPGERVVP